MLFRKILLFLLFGKGHVEMIVLALLVRLFGWLAKLSSIATRFLATASVAVATKYVADTSSTRTNLHVSTIRTRDIKAGAILHRVRCRGPAGRGLPTSGNVRRTYIGTS